MLKNKVNISDGFAETIQPDEKEEIVSPENKVSGSTGVDKLLARFSSKNPIKEESGFSENQDDETTTNGGIETPAIDIDLEISGASKKRGRERKSKQVAIPADTMVKIASIFITKALVFSMKNILKKKCDDSDFDLSDSEIELISPLAEDLIRKYLAEFSTEILLIYALGTIYGGKVLGVMSNDNISEYGNGKQK